MLLLAFLMPAFAQQSKFKPPLVMSFLGGHRNDTVTTETAKLILSLPLQVTDTKKTAYTIENYRFLYRRKSVAVENGEAVEKFTISAGTFTEVPLPKVWIDNVGLNLQPGEQFYFFDIIVHDKDGHRFLAPDVKIFIK